MKVDTINRVGLRLHESIEAHGSVALVNGEDIQGYALGEYVNGVVGPAWELVIVTVMLQDKAVDVDTGGVIE